MTFLKLVCSFIFVIIFSLAYADAPVVDYSQPVASDNARAVSVKSPADDQPQFSDQPRNIAPTQSNFTAEQRIAKLEQQINNLNQQNLSKRLDDLQQQLQKISGDLEVQSHAVAELDEQLKSFYQDLNQRMQKQEGVTVKPASIKGEITAKITNSPSVKTAAKSETAAATDKEQQMYQDAFNLLQSKKNKEATTKFNAYISAYSNGNYAANAHYWLGEIYFAAKQFKLAITEFETVVGKYSSSTKVPDALFKLSLIYDQIGKSDLAKKNLNTLQKRYPHSSAAQLAKQQG